jgi:signal transduction histidine kinase
MVVTVQRTAAPLQRGGDVRTTAGAPPHALDGAVLLGAAATRLTADAGALAPVLDDVVRALGLRSAVLRSRGGAVRAVAGEVVHAVPASRTGTGPEAVVELPVPGGASLTVVGARPSQLPVLRALAAVLGLALRTSPAEVPLALLEAADADADEVADALHDGPVQQLVVARLAADAAVRGGDPAHARDAVLAALQSLRRALWLLRSRGTGEGGLAGALEALSGRLPETGRPPLALQVDPGACDALPPAAAAVAYRFVQAAARAVDVPLGVRVGRAGSAVVVRVDADVPAPERWSVRARALGATLSCGPGVGTELRLPAPRPPHEDEAAP